MNLEKLRLETRSEHEATESAMPLMHSDLTRHAYAKVLCRLYPVVRGWEEWGAAHAPEDLTALLKGRRRSELISHDLRWLTKPISRFQRDQRQIINIEWLLGAT